MVQGLLQWEQAVWKRLLAKPFAKVILISSCPHFVQPRLRCRRGQAAALGQQAQVAGGGAAAGPRCPARAQRAPRQPHAAGSHCGRSSGGTLLARLFYAVVAYLYCTALPCCIPATATAFSAAITCGPAARTSSLVPLPDILPASAISLLCPCPCLQIWEACNQGQVLQVEPFRPWEELAAQGMQLPGTPTVQVRGLTGLGWLVSRVWGFAGLTAWERACTGVDLTNKLSMNFPGASACTAPPPSCERVSPPPPPRRFFFVSACSLPPAADPAGADGEAEGRAVQSAHARLPPHSGGAQVGARPPPCLG